MPGKLFACLMWHVHKFEFDTHMQAFAAASKAGAPLKEPFSSSIANFYMTDTISRSSQTMARCVQARQAAL